MLMWSKRLTQSDEERIRREAATEATLVAQLSNLLRDFTSHQILCTTRYEEGEKAQAEMHKQNTEKFEKINRIIWFATGGWGAVTFLTSIGVLAYEFFFRR